MKQVPLSMSRRCPNKGRYVAVVDDADFAVVSRHFWSVHILRKGRATQVYAARNGADGRRVLLHRAIAEMAFGRLPDRSEVDHINGDGLNNCRENLRVANRSGNMANAGIRSSNTSGFKGVSWDSSRGSWGAKIKVNYKAIFLGRHSNAEDAARAYDAAAVAHFGAFARLNFPHGVA